VSPKRTVLNSAGIPAGTVLFWLARRLPLVLLAVALLGSRADVLSGAVAPSPITVEAGLRTAGEELSLVEQAAGRATLQPGGRPLGSSHAEAPCESETSDEGDANGDGVPEQLQTRGIQPSRRLHAESSTPLTSRTHSSSTPRAPPASSSPAPVQ
jgi:hypothetical protein